MENQIIQGDCLEKLKDLEDNSVDSVVTDPPYELGFMGKSWDNTGIANNKEMWAECLRVLKPGGHLLSFGGTRTYHRMASAIEDAGFEIRDMIEWVYGSGFPKSLNIGKAVDKIQGNEREDLGEHPTINGTGKKWRKNGSEIEYVENSPHLTKGTSQYEGWGTALKPAHEPICMARKPLGYWETKNTLTAKEKDEFQDLWDKMEAGIPYDEKKYEELWAKKEVKVFKSLSVAENCLKYGTGGINIDGSRVGIDGGTRKGGNIKRNIDPSSMDLGIGIVEDIGMGRFPANLIHDNSEEVQECFPGNASRFFKSIIYQAKASKGERNKGCEGLEDKTLYEADNDHGNLGHFLVKMAGGDIGDKIVRKNNHPTVKPIALMEYLIKMVTPRGGIVLDPFAGSGTTLIAAKKNGFNYIGIELNAEYIKIAEARLKAVQTPLL